VGPRNHVLDIAERFESNAVIWAFHTIQPSSDLWRDFAGKGVLNVLGGALPK